MLTWIYPSAWLLGQEQGKIIPWFGSYTIYYLLLLFFTVSNVPLIVQHYDIMFHNLIFIFISFEQALYYTGEACNSSTGTKTQKNLLICSFTSPDCSSYRKLPKICNSRCNKNPYKLGNQPGDQKTAILVLWYAGSITITCSAYIKATAKRSRFRKNTYRSLCTIILLSMANSESPCVNNPKLLSDSR